MDAHARRAWGPLPWSQADALVVVVATTIDLIGHLLIGQVDEGRGVSVPGFVLVALSGLPLLAQRRRPLEVLAAVLVSQAVIDQVVPTTTHFGAVLTVALYAVGRHRPLRDTAAASVVTTVVVSLSQSHFALPSWSQVLATVAAAVIVAGAGVAVARWQREVAAKRRLLADRAVAEERRRIARELHDIVAHHITTMQLMAGGARANLERPEVVRDSLVTLESSGRLALREMRQLLTVLRSDDDEPQGAPPAPQPGAEDVQRLVDESCLAGLPTELIVDGPRQPLPPTVGLTVFRIVQEGLTNARKYAGSARASVRLTYLPDLVTVEVRDDGAGAAASSPQQGRGGYGLIGMRERVALHGGALEAGPQEGGGFAVVAELPLTAAESAEAAVQSGEVAR